MIYLSHAKEVISVKLLFFYGHCALGGEGGRERRVNSTSMKNWTSVFFDWKEEKKSFPKCLYIGGSEPTVSQQ